MGPRCRTPWAGVVWDEGLHVAGDPGGHRAIPADMRCTLLLRGIPEGVVEVGVCGGRRGTRQGCAEGVHTVGPQVNSAKAGVFSDLIFLVQTSGLPLQGLLCLKKNLGKKKKTPPNSPVQDGLCGTQVLGGGGEGGKAWGALGPACRSCCVWLRLCGKLAWGPGRRSKAELIIRAPCGGESRNQPSRGWARGGRCCRGRREASPFRGLVWEAS